MLAFTPTIVHSHLASSTRPSSLPSPEKSDGKAIHPDQTSSDFLGEGLGVRVNTHEN